MEKVVVVQCPYEIDLERSCPLLILLRTQEELESMGVRLLQAFTPSLL